MPALPPLHGFPASQEVGHPSAALQYECDTFLECQQEGKGKKRTCRVPLGLAGLFLDGDIGQLGKVVERWCEFASNPFTRGYKKVTAGSVGQVKSRGREIVVLRSCTFWLG